MVREDGYCAVTRGNVGIDGAISQTSGTFPSVIIHIGCPVHRRAICKPLIISAE